jgi:hypothetical protein
LVIFACRMHFLKKERRQPGQVTNRSGLPPVRLTPA